MTLTFEKTASKDRFVQLMRTKRAKSFLLQAIWANMDGQNKRFWVQYASRQGLSP